MKLFTITFAVPAGDEEFSFWREAAVLDSDEEAKGYSLAKFEIEVDGAETGVQDAYVLVQAREYEEGETLEVSNDPEAEMDAFGPLVGEWTVIDEGESWSFQWEWGGDMEEGEEEPAQLDA
jgi:hypothetical protein